MENGRQNVIDAMRPVLSPLAIDEETLESLAEVIMDAAAEEPNTAVVLAKKLEELLEGYLCAFGAGEGCIRSASLQAAVALRGMPELDHGAQAKETNTIPHNTPQVAANSRGGYQVDASVPMPRAPAKNGLTLESFCSNPGGQIGAMSAGGDSFGRVVGGALGAPISMGALWATKGDETTSFWEINGEANRAEDLEEDVIEGNSKGTEQDAAVQEESPAANSIESSKIRRSCGSALKKGQRKEGTTLATEQSLRDIALYGLGQNGSTADADTGRRIHAEGVGGKNVHMVGLSVSVVTESGSVDLLKDTDLHLNAGRIYGLVGKNGSGKTTLLRRMAARAIPGLPAHLRFGYVAQELAALGDGTRTVLEVALLGDVERTALLEERQQLEMFLDNVSNSTDPEELKQADVRAARFIEVEQRLEAIEADTADERARGMLKMLYFDDTLMNTPVRNLSGGWQMRLALVQALLGRPDVLLLDEPTNHLDLHGVMWLQDHLRKEWGAECRKKDRIIVVVSHDRSFLDACVTDILEIRALKLRTFSGNYSSYTEKVAEEQNRLLMQYEKEEREIREAKKEIRAMKKTARDHKDDKRVKQLQAEALKLDQTAASKLSSKRDLTDDIMSRLREDAGLRFKFPDPEAPFTEENLLELDNASISRQPNGPPILRNVTLTLDCASRVAIVGENGAGKSTLLQALAGELTADEGPRGRGRKYRAYCPGYVAQGHLERQAQHLQGDCVDYLKFHLPTGEVARGAQGPHLSQKSEEPQLRAHLGNFGLGRDATKKVGSLSGGQRARLSMSVAAARCPNVLLLDEPTNHLDVDSLDALCLGLQAFVGAVVIVSHNRGFMEALCDELWIVQRGTVKVCAKGEEAFAEYFDKYARGPKLVK